MPSFVLEDINGIGPKTLKLLRSEKIDSVHKLAQMTVKELMKVKGIGESSANKFIAGAKTLLEKPLGSEPTELTRSVGLNMNIIEKIQSEISNIHTKLEQINHRLKKVENKVNIDTDSIIEVSEDQFFRIVKTSYNTLEKKFGGFVLISDLTEKIKDIIPWPKERIHKQLYSLFLSYKVELQPGKTDEGTPLMQDGKNLFGLN